MIIEYWIDGCSHYVRDSLPLIFFPADGSNPKRISWHGTLIFLAPKASWKALAFRANELRNSRWKLGALRWKLWKMMLTSWNLNLKLCLKWCENDGNSCTWWSLYICVQQWLTHRNRKIVTLHEFEFFHLQLNTGFAWSASSVRGIKATTLRTTWMAGDDASTRKSVVLVLKDISRSHVAKVFIGHIIRNAYLGQSLHLSWSQAWPKLYAMAKLTFGCISEAIDQSGSGLLWAGADEHEACSHWLQLMHLSHRRYTIPIV